MTPPGPATRRTPRARAFSLIEVLAVTIVLAVLAGAVALRMDGALEGVRHRAFLDQIRLHDRLARAAAGRGGAPAELVYDLDAERLLRGDQGERAVASAGRGVNVAAVLVRDGAPSRSGRVAVAVSAPGVAPSYAVLVEGPGSRRSWVLFAGLTGQPLETDDDAEIRSLLGKLATPGAHAG